MTEERTDLIDRTLQYLYDRPNKYVSLITVFLREWDIKDRVLLNSIVGELETRGWVDLGHEHYNVCLNYEGRVMLEKYGSYSSFLRRENMAKRSGKWRAMLTNAKTIIVIVTSSGMFIFGILAHYKDKANDRLQEKNEKLQHIIDSLTTKKPSLQVSEKDSVTN